MITGKVLQGNGNPEIIVRYERINSPPKSRLWGRKIIRKTLLLAEVRLD